jgi:hypothetical protein
LTGPEPSRAPPFHPDQNLPCSGCNIEYLDWREEGCQLSWCWQCSKPYCTWCLERPRTHPCRGKAVQHVRAALQSKKDHQDDEEDYNDDKKEELRRQAGEPYYYDVAPRDGAPKAVRETTTAPAAEDVEEDDGPAWSDVDDDDLNDVNDDRDREGERIREDLDLGERIQAILIPREGAPQDPEQAVAAAHLRLQQAPDQVHYLRLRARVAAGEPKDKRQKT